MECFSFCSDELGEKTENKLLLLTSADKWILSKVNTLAKDVTENMDHYELGLQYKRYMTSFGMNM